MSTIIFKDLNARISKSANLLEVVNSDTFEEDLKNLNINWKTGAINSKSPLVPVFKEFGFIESGANKLTISGLLFTGRISIDLENELLKKESIEGKYKIVKNIQIGKNSCTFLAKHIILGTSVVLKFLRPGAAENITSSLSLISSEKPISNLILPWDFIKVNIIDVFGNSVEIDCLVFQYIQGISLKQFLADDKTPLNAYALAAFIKQISNVLAYLEKKGAYHGDLHEENIIVNTDDSGYLQFNIIDVSFGIKGSQSSEICKDNDLIFFRQHIWNFLSAQQKYLTKMSLRKYLGAEIFSIITTVMLDGTKSFEEIHSLFRYNKKYEDYKTKKQSFLHRKFSPPGTFKLQRYEEITDQSVALKLFVPFPEMMQLIQSFSNIIISGTRGSGKSTYLAAIAFSPRADNNLVNYREIFGIYFPCRQGEFRLLSGEMINYSKYGLASVKPVLIVKIIRRTLEILADAIECGKLVEPESYGSIKKVLSAFLGKREIVSLDVNIVSEIRNIVSTMVRVEMKVIDDLFNSKSYIQKYVASEITILDFFKEVRASFRELTDTRFHLLFDDAGTPNIPLEVQSMINDLIVSSNPIFCVKISTEKNSYELKTTDEKQLENGHDYFEYDINSIFYTGTKTFGLDDDKLKQYFKMIVRNRLIHFGYQSNNIIDYLGDDMVKLENLVNSLSAGRRNAYYCGWSMVWKIASGNPRNLLELISEIFSVSNTDEKTLPNIISSRNQDRAIRAVSEKRLRSIAQISGVIKVHGKEFSLGKKLFDITLSIGSVFRIYLQNERGKKRKDQYLAIERNELSELSEEAEQILRELIKYGIFDDSRLDISRDDRIKKPIYILNRIFCPVFGISYRRDQHLRLSKVKFEQLLLQPTAFVNDGTKRLRIASRNNSDIQSNLFDEFNEQ